MTKTIEAIYENGVFRPTQPFTLTEGERVEVSVPVREEYPSPQELLRSILEVAALGEKPPEDGLSAIDHDRILYGSKDGPL